MSRMAAFLLALLLTLPAVAQPVRVGPLDVRNALGEIAASGGTAQAAARVNLGLGSLATQGAAGVAITGGTISGVTISLGAAGGANVTATGGSAARTLAAWMSDRHNVRGLGAVGDGTAIDLAALTTGVSPWYLPDGTFNTGALFANLNPGAAIRRWSNGGGAGVIKTTEGLQSGNIAFIKAPPSYSGSSAFASLFNGDMQCHLCFQNYVAGVGTLGLPTTGYQYNYPATGILGAIYNTSGHEESLDTNDGRTNLSAVMMKLYQGGNGDLVAYGATGLITGVREGSTYFLGAPVASMIAGDFAAGVDGPYIDVDEIQIRDNGHLAAGAGVVRNMFRDATGPNISPNYPWMGFRIQSLGVTPIDVFYSMAGTARIGVDFTTVTGNFVDYAGTRTGAAIVMADGQMIYGNATNANLRHTSMSSDTVLGTETWGYTAANGWAAVVGGTPILRATANGVSVTQLRITSPTVPTAANDNCTTGQIAYDPDHFYACVATNTWRRAPLVSWP